METKSNYHHVRGPRSDPCPGENRQPGIFVRKSSEVALQAGRRYRSPTALRPALSQLAEGLPACPGLLGGGENPRMPLWFCSRAGTHPGDVAGAHAPEAALTPDPGNPAAAAAELTLPRDIRGNVTTGCHQAGPQGGSADADMCWPWRRHGAQGTQNMDGIPNFFLHNGPVIPAQRLSGSIIGIEYRKGNRDLVRLLQQISNRRDLAQVPVRNRSLFYSMKVWIIPAR